MNKVLHPMARLLVATIFLMSGAGKLAAFSATAQMMGSVGFPAPELFLAGAIAFELIGGLLLLVGYKARAAAVALIVFLIPATLIFHVSGLPDQEQMVQTLKNLAILGALVAFVANGAGSAALDPAKA